MKIFEVIASTDFFLFLLGLYGMALGEKVYEAIKRCRQKTFSYIFVVVLYVFVALST